MTNHRSKKLLVECKRVEASNFTQRVIVLLTIFFQNNVSAAARALGIPRNTLHQIARGFVTSPSAKVYVALKLYSGRSIDWWITGEGR